MFRTFTALALALVVLYSQPAAQTRMIPVSEVRVGMVGVGRTVFQGSTLEDFKVTILGVMKNVIGPKRDLILARLEGGPLAKTGVIAGMSGSPVYIDGRLLGAVSYALGQFSTEAICGITPIAEMVDATAAPAIEQSARPVALSWPASPRELIDIWSRDLGRASPIAVDAAQALVLSGASSDFTRMGAMLRPIAVPLVASGFDASVLSPLTSAFSAAGFLPMSGSSQTQGSSPANHTLVPGDAIGVGLMTGDFEIGATGTVTHVDGNRVYAFGHPMYNLGPTEFPMMRADIPVVLPSLLASTKLSTMGPIVGTLQQDRATAIAGRLGPGPSLIPMTVTLNSDRGAPRTFAFNLVRDVTFTPLLAYLSVANVLTSYERGVGPASFSIRGTATIRSEGDISFEDIFTGDQPAGGAAAYIAAPLTALMKNSSEQVNVDRIALTIDASEKQKTARIDRVWLDSTRPRGGETVVLNVALRTAGGDEIIRKIDVQLPANVTGPLQLTVADAARTNADDRRDTRGPEVQKVSQIVRTFNRQRRNNRLYVRITSAEPGAVVNGEPMAALPPSVLAVIESDRNSGTVGTLHNVIRGEWEVSLDVAVTGSRQLTLNLDQP